MDRLEEEVAPHALGVDVALAAFGVRKGSAKMPEEARKIEIAYPGTQGPDHRGSSVALTGRSQYPPMYRSTPATSTIGWGR
jgi:hypothetical protein